MKTSKLKKEDIGKYLYVSDMSGLFWMIGLVTTPHLHKESNIDEYRGLATFISSNGGINFDSLWCYVCTQYKEQREYREATQEEIDYLKFCAEKQSFYTKEQFEKNKFIPLIFN